MGSFDGWVCWMFSGISIVIYWVLYLCVSFPHYLRTLFDLTKSNYALQWVSQSLPILMYTKWAPRHRITLTGT